MLTNCAEAKHGKELVRTVVILEGIASYTEVDEACKGKERGEIHNGSDSVQRSGSRKYMRKERARATEFQIYAGNESKRKDFTQIDIKVRPWRWARVADVLAINLTGLYLDLPPVIRHAWAR